MLDFPHQKQRDKLQNEMLHSNEIEIEISLPSSVAATDDTRRENNRGSSMFQLVRLTGRQVKKTNAQRSLWLFDSVRRVESPLLCLGRSPHGCGCCSLGCDWRLPGNRPGVLDAWGRLDVGRRVTVQQGTGGVCVCTMVCW